MPIKQSDEVKIKILSILSNENGINKGKIIKLTKATKEKVNNALAYLKLTQDIIEEKESHGTRLFYKFYISEHGLETLKNTGHYVGKGTVKKSPTIPNDAIESKVKESEEKPKPEDWVLEDDYNINFQAPDKDENIILEMIELATKLIKTALRKKEIDSENRFISNKKYPHNQPEYIMREIRDFDEHPIPILDYMNEMKMLLVDSKEFVPTQREATEEDILRELVKIMVRLRSPFMWDWVEYKEWWGRFFYLLLTRGEVDLHEDIRLEYWKMINE